MIKLLISSIVFGILINPASAQKNPPELTHGSRTIQLTDKFSKIILNGDADIVLVKDLVTEIVIEEPANIENTVKIKDRNEELIINCREILFGKKPLILIPVTALKSLELNGNGSVSSAVMIQSKQLNVFVNGSCKIHLVATGEILFESSPDYYLDYKKQSHPALSQTN